MLYYKIRLIRCSSIVAMIMTMVAAANPNSSTKLPGAYDALATFYLPSVHQAVHDEEQKIKKTQADNEKLLRKGGGLFNDRSLQLSKVQDNALGDLEALRIAYDVFQQNDKTENKQPRLADHVCKDLSLFYSGDPNKPQHSLFAHLDHTTTIAGKIQLQKMLLEPITNEPELLQRQKIILTLLQDPVLFKELEEQLTIIKNNEKELLWFWKEHPDAIKDYYSLPYFQHKALQKGNASEALLEMSHRKTTLIDPILAAIMTPLSMVLSTWIQEKNTAKNPRSFFQIAKDGARSLFSKHIPNLYSIIVRGYITEEIVTKNSNGTITYHKYKHTPEPWVRLAVIASSIIMPYIFYKGMSMACNIAKSHHKVATSIHKKLIGTAAFCTAVKTLSSTSERNKELTSTSFIQDSGTTISNTSNQNKLLNTLSSSTFTGDPTIFSLRGKVLTTFADMQKNCNTLADLMVFAGKMDAFLSIVKYCKLLSKNQFCFVDYVSQAKPHLVINGLWHPMLNAASTVTNDVTLSGREGNVQHMIITGPNAGGKSTFLRQIIIAVIMAQTFGVATAQHMTLSPFTTIETYLNVSDSTGFMSLFQAEADRMANIQHRLAALHNKPNQLSIGIYDEIYTGTDDTTAIKEASIDINKLCSMPHNIMILATHHHSLAHSLEQTKHRNRLANYKVAVQETQRQGKPFYTSTFKVTAGISNQKIGSFVCQEARSRYNRA